MSLNSGSVGTPQYPPPPPIAGSHANSFDQGEHSAIDLNLINPPGSEPKASVPQGGTSLPSPGENTAFVLPPPDGKQSKKSKLKKGIGGIGDSFRGGFSKVRGKLKKAPRIEEGNSIEEPSEDDIRGSRDYLEEYDKPPGALNDYDTKPGRIDSYSYDSKTPPKSFLPPQVSNAPKSTPKPQDADPSPYQAGDVVLLVEKRQSAMERWMTFGNFINILLLCYIIAGFIMCCCIGVNGALYYIGPAALGLGIFALIGKLYYTMVFWKEDPLPRFLQAPVRKVETLIGGNPDPYGHLVEKKPLPNPGVTVYHGPMTTSSSTRVVQMETFTYPGPGLSTGPSGEAKMYDESIDARLRQSESGSNRNLYLDAPHLATLPPTYSSQVPAHSSSRDTSASKLPW